MAENAEPTKDVPFAVENARQEDCLDYKEFPNFKEAYLKLHIKTNNKFLPGRMEILNDQTTTWKNISDNNSVEKERRFEKMEQAQLVGQHLTDEKTRLRKDLKETKLQKQQFLDPGKSYCPVDVEADLKLAIGHLINLQRGIYRDQEHEDCPVDVEADLKLAIRHLINLQRGIYRDQEHEGTFSR